MYLSVVIPCYNEEKNLKRGVLDEIEKYLTKQDFSSEVIIADDGSTDGSLKFLDKYIKYHPRFKFLRNRHAGKPYALKAGLKSVKGEIILFTDMDQSAPITELRKLLPYFKENYKVVIGSRGLTRKNFPLYRQLASVIFRFLRQGLLLREIVDTQCGFKAFEREVAREIFSKLTIFKEEKKVKGWRVTAYDVEALFIAKKLSFRIKEVPVNWEDKDVARGKQKNFIKESWEMFTEILRVRLNDLKEKY